MGITRLLGGSDHEDDGEANEVVYWCTVCGMTFERSCSQIDYSWCTRCGAEEVRKILWPSPDRPD